MKKLFITIFILTLSVNCFSQVNSSEIPQDTARIYCFTKSELVKFGTWKAQKDFYQTESGRLSKLDSVNTIYIQQKETKIKSLNDIIFLKDEQIQKLVLEPKQIIQQTNYSFWEISGIVLGSFALGALTGLIIK